MNDYAPDRFGDRIYPGDYVECITDEYFSVKGGARKRVLAVIGDCIVLNNTSSPTFDSPYRATNLRLAGRYHPYHSGVDKRHPKRKYLTNSEKKGTDMLHLAIRIKDNMNYEALARSINNWNTKDDTNCPAGVREGAPITHPNNVMADVTVSALKERIEARINRNPDERWLIVSGNTIAESSAPPVAYRQW